MMIIIIIIIIIIIMECGMWNGKARQPDARKSALPNLELLLI